MRDYSIVTRYWSGDKFLVSRRLSADAVESLSPLPWPSSRAVGRVVQASQTLTAALSRPRTKGSRDIDREAQTPRALLQAGLEWCVEDP
jgi:hypothetical protein